jgi:hypothetical protein
MEDYYTHRNQGHRYLIKKIDDSEDIQFVDADGMADEQHTKLMRVYPHGFSSHSVDEAHMLALGLGGRRDLLVALGGEHHQKRPKNLPKGDTVLYNAEGDVIRLFGKKTLDITHAKNIKLSIGKGLKDSSGGGQNSGSNGPSQGGKEAEAGEDKDVTIVITEKDITLTKGKTTVKLTGRQPSVRRRVRRRLRSQGRSLRARATEPRRSRRNQPDRRSALQGRHRVRPVGDRLRPHRLRSHEMDIRIRDAEGTADQPFLLWDTSGIRTISIPRSAIGSLQARARPTTRTGSRPTTRSTLRSCSRCSRGDAPSPTTRCRPAPTRKGGGATTSISKRVRRSSARGLALLIRATLNETARTG